MLKRRRFGWNLADQKRRNLGSNRKIYHTQGLSVCSKLSFLETRSAQKDTICIQTRKNTLQRRFHWVPSMLDCDRQDLWLNELRIEKNETLYIKSKCDEAWVVMWKQWHN